MISKEEVKHIAKLARLELTEKETQKMQKDLSAILDYFNLLKTAPKMKTQPAETKTSAWRKDEVLLRDEGKADEIVAQAPDKKDDYIKVKTIL